MLRLPLSSPPFSMSPSPVPPRRVLLLLVLPLVLFLPLSLSGCATTPTTGTTTTTTTPPSTTLQTLDTIIQNALTADDVVVTTATAALQSGLINASQAAQILAVTDSVKT